MTTITLTLRRPCRRVSPLQWLLILAIVANLIVYLNLARYKPEASGLTHKGSSSPPPGSLTFVYSEFEHFENHISEVTRRAHDAYPDGDILVISDKRPYPPIKLPRQARLHTLNPMFNTSVPCLSSVIKTELVMLIPDGSDVMSYEAVSLVLREFHRMPDTYRILAWSAFAMPNIQCLGLKVDYKKWSIHFNKQKRPDKCDALKGDFVLLMRTADLLELSKPFAHPLEDALFMQTAAKGWKIKFTRSLTFRTTGEIFTNGHTRWKHQLRQVERQRAFYENFGVKYVHTADDIDEWYGCTKKSNRCFPTVVNDMPDYLYEGRWTPPCCLKALRSTIRHVLTILESEGIRYWLEGGSLLGAARHEDVIPWDYDADIGIYGDDIVKSRHLYRLRKNNFEDDQGYVWEKATEGNFFRVQFSQTNHLHVDIFPFYSKDGVMTKDTWIAGHPQDREFPETFLQPLEKMNFAGVSAYVPNRYREFLELKFGKGVIENPQYPNASQTKHR